METLLPLHALEAEATQILGDVFQTMLGLPVSPVGEPENSPQPGGLTSAVYFAGTFKGAVLFECTSAQACAISARLGGGPEPDVPNDDVRDALGEVANMLGGNLKAVLPRGAGLSLPSVVNGSDYALRIPGARIIHRIAFASELGQFVVTLIAVVEP